MFLTDNVFTHNAHRARAQRCHPRPISNFYLASKDPLILRNRSGADKCRRFDEMPFGVHTNKRVAQLDSLRETAALSRDFCSQERVVGSIVEERGKSI